MNNWLEQLKSFKFLENDIVAFLLLLVTVVLAILDRIAGASLLGGLFVVVVLFRTLPQMKSFKGAGFQVEYRDALKNIETSRTSTAAVRTELDQIKHDTRALLERKDLPQETILSIEQVNSTADLAGQKLQIVESANTALDQWLKSPLSRIENVTLVDGFDQQGKPKKSPRPTK
jgi:hypothetical protein